MQIIGLHKNIYKLYAYTRTQETINEYKTVYAHAVSMYHTLHSLGATPQVCKEKSKISRATYYRHKKKLADLEKGIFPPLKRPKHVNKPKWGESEKQWVLKIRRENPTYGKDKIAIILKRDHGLSLSASTVGRIIKYLKTKGLITHSSSALRTKRKRNFTSKHAQPWTFKQYKDMQMGERIQVDHMTVTKNGIVVKHFQAWDRKSKYMHTSVYSHAKASSAKRFLLELVKVCPFPILSIQVDGGSEFMADFEDACAELKIPLFVLPPRKPQYNGGVERGNRTFREEFYNKSDLLADSVRGIQAELVKALHKYNHYRPHKNLKGLTPMQYILHSQSLAA